MGLLLCYIVLFSEIKLEKYVCESKYVRPFLWTRGVLNLRLIIIECLACFSGNR